MLPPQTIGRLVCIELFDTQSRCFLRLRVSWLAASLGRIQRRTRRRCLRRPHHLTPRQTTDIQP
jgi:hypothetical protein